MVTGPLLFRCDAGVEMGIGHIMRSLALAQAWQDQRGKVAFLCADFLPILRDRFDAEQIPIHPIQTKSGSPEDATETVRLFLAQKAGFLVVDGYQFRDEFLHTLACEAIPFLIIDDCGRNGLLPSRFVLNQNIHARADMYPSLGRNTRLLLGTEFALLRREFRNTPRGPHPIPDTASKVLVVAGGTDPRGLTAKILEAMESIEDDVFEVRVIGPHAVENERVGHHPIAAFDHVGNLSEHLRWADLVVSAAGSTVWETLFLGVPAILVSIAANQEPTAQALAAQRVVRFLGSVDHVGPKHLAAEIHSLAHDSRSRRRMSEAGPRIVDGKGAERVCAAIGGST
ncbi:MAG: UDP-2,4-diacetamido-2,4,6-trideoxy-beta-L-altropyranose hydrolase [Pseudomonadota bacterium]